MVVVMVMNGDGGDGGDNDGDDDDGEEGDGGDKSRVWETIGRLVIVHMK